MMMMMMMMMMAMELDALDKERFIFANSGTKHFRPGRSQK
jgi:hypothetical protein